MFDLEHKIEVEELTDLQIRLTALQNERRRILKEINRLGEQVDTDQNTEINIRLKIANLEYEINGYNIQLENPDDPNDKQKLRDNIQTKENLLNTQLQRLQQPNAIPPPPPPPPPRVIKPENMNGGKLYQREEASKKIVYTFFDGSGLKKTPICDNSFGAGKTSLIYKFREILNNLPPESWSWPKGSERLQNAVYVHVPLDYEPTIHSNVDFTNPISIDMMLIRKCSDIFSRCFNQQNLDTTSLEAFIQSVMKLAGNFTLLVHFDEVGVFDLYENGKNVLYCILHFGEALRRIGHYYVVTGRSSYLHTIGRNIKAYDPAHRFVSPCLVVLIPLPLLNIDSIILMFKEYKTQLPAHLFDANDEPNMEVVKHIYSYSGGVPRAVYLALQCYIENSNATAEKVEITIRTHCRITLENEDRDIFYFCINLSWAQIRVDDETILCEERITDIIARLGIYRDNYDYNDQTFTLQVPYFLAVTYQVSSQNLMDIAKIPNKGDRFEIGFRSIFHLRTAIKLTSWTEFGLPCLDSKNFPFPSQFFKTSLSFPKIANNGSNNLNAAQQCMKDINTNKSISNSIFHSDCLPTLCSEMEIGRYYQPFEKSSSADAMVRCGEHDLLCFQFKNLQDPFKNSQFSDEMKKCIIPGWNVILILVCSNGYQIDYKKKKKDDQLNLTSTADLEVDVTTTDLEVNLTSTTDSEVEVEDNTTVPEVIVKGILLSINSVKHFFGQNAVSNLTSTSMYNDAIQRQEQIPSILGKRRS